LAICALSVALSATGGEAYTNLAGKVIVAKPVKVEAGQVVFSRRVASDALGAAEVELPLKAFPPGEQKRIKLAVGIREMPGELKGLADEIEGQRKRYEARAAAGRLSKEKLAENLEMLSGSWRHAVEESKLSDEEKAYWVKGERVKR